MGINRGGGVRMTDKKRSTRAAGIVKPVEYAGRWFYFSNDDQVIITDLSSFQ